MLAASLRGAYGTDSTLDDVLVAFAVARVEVASSARRLGGKVARSSAPSRFGRARGSDREPAMCSSAARGRNPDRDCVSRWNREDYARMRWVGLKLDSDGRVLAQIRVSSPNFATQAAMTLDGLDGTDRVVVVGVNVGGTEHTFLPAQGEWEAHGWTLTVESLP